jgi:hypothetical protein
MADCGCSYGECKGKDKSGGSKDGGDKKKEDSGKKDGGGKDKDTNSDGVSVVHVDPNSLGLSGGTGGPIGNISNMEVTGSATALASFKSVVENATGNTNVVSFEGNRVHLTATAKAIDMTTPEGKRQFEFVKVFNQVVNSKVLVKFFILDRKDGLKSNQVQIGNASRGSQSLRPGYQSIDISDIEVFGQDGIITAGAVLAHELFEGYKIEELIDNGKIKREDRVVMMAHLNGFGVQALVDDLQKVDNLSGEGQITTRVWFKGKNESLWTDAHSVFIVLDGKKNVKEIKNNKRQ